MSSTANSVNTPPRRQKAVVWWVLGGVGVLIALTIVLAAIYAPSVTEPAPTATPAATEAPAIEAPSATVVAPDDGAEAGAEPAAAAE